MIEWIAGEERISSM